MPDQPWSYNPAAAALTGLAEMGPARLHKVLAGHHPIEAVEWVCHGGVPDGIPQTLSAAWRAALCRFDPGAAEARLKEGSLTATWNAAPRHPTFLTDDLGPAPVLFWRSCPIDETAPAVAIAGTRRASGIGREIARELGSGLAEAGVTVVSGPVLGIDGSAHEGAFPSATAPPVAFVGGGGDVVYPKRHHELWGRMVEFGTVAAEAPPGERPSPWRFLARNPLSLRRLTSW